MMKCCWCWRRPFMNGMYLVCVAGIGLSYCIMWLRILRCLIRCLKIQKGNRFPLEVCCLEIGNLCVCLCIVCLCVCVSAASFFRVLLVVFW
uniref:P10 n=1 Tax=Higrevirus waimanalo TaxID=3047949 RepID=A0AA51NI22_9VIRU|nr:P10 [Higrevirus waimanalo]